MDVLEQRGRLVRNPVYFTEARYAEWRTNYARALEERDKLRAQVASLSPLEQPAALSLDELRQREYDLYVAAYRQAPPDPRARLKIAPPTPTRPEQIEAEQQLRQVRAQIAELESAAPAEGHGATPSTAPGTGSSSAEESVVRARQRERVEKAIKWRADENLSAAQIAKRLGISVDTLNRAFRALGVDRPWLTRTPQNPRMRGPH